MIAVLAVVLVLVLWAAVLAFARCSPLRVGGEARRRAEAAHAEYVLIRARRQLRDGVDDQLDARVDLDAQRMRDQLHGWDDVTPTYRQVADLLPAWVVEDVERALAGRRPVLRGDEPARKARVSKLWGGYQRVIVHHRNGTADVIRQTGADVAQTISTMMGEQ